MAILGPADREDPDEKKQREKAVQGLRPEQILDAELKDAFPMRQWGWQQRRRYVHGLDTVLYQHIMGREREV